MHPDPHQIDDSQRSEWQLIRDALISGCSEQDFLAMACPICESRLKLTVRPQALTFFVRCGTDTTHLSMHDETAEPIEWMKKYNGGGWY